MSEVGKHLRIQEPNAEGSTPDNSPLGAASKNRVITFIDLFAGCGGLSEGFLLSRKFEGLAHVEWEKAMVDTLRNRLVSHWGENFESAQNSVIHFDIQKSSELIEGHWSDESIQAYGKTNSQDVINNGLKGVIGKRNVDIVIGGPPCQAYSIHGRAQDPNSMNNDYRNYLFESFIEVVSEFKPKVFLFENVVGMLTARPGGTPITERIFSAFEKAGYKTYTPSELKDAIFDTYDFEIPQHRERVIIIGVRKDLPYAVSDFYKEINSRKSTRRLSVKDAIGMFPKLYPLAAPIKEGRLNISHSSHNNPSITQHIARYHSRRDILVFHDWVSNNLNKLKSKDKVLCYKKVTGRDTLYVKYRNLEWNKPSPTIVAHLQKDGFMFIHPDAQQARSITIREAATLMSFPLDFQFIGSNASCFKMIGNAVPVRFAEALADALYDVITRVR